MTCLAVDASQGLRHGRESTKWNNFENLDPYEWEATEQQWEHDKTTLGGQEEVDQDQEDGDDEDVLLAEDAWLMEDEYHMEPTRLQAPVEISNSLDQEEDLSSTHATFRLRGGYEEDLKSDPFIVKFPGTAGASSMNNENADTYQENAPAGNPFAPFLSKLDWEVARWAKLRGPGSTAFSELMGIEGVSDVPLMKYSKRTHHASMFEQKIPEKLGLSFKNTRELNAIIDKKLSGRPRFQRHMVRVGSETCEVFYRDIVECIRSLFGDQTFTPYLHFAPEKHYTDDTKDSRMYHDMHTGKWWWATQVSDSSV